MKTSKIYDLLRYYSDAYIKKNENDRAFDAYTGQQNCIQFWLEILKEREQLEDVSVTGKITLKRMLKQ